jgi:hypothetical protein
MKAYEGLKPWSLHLTLMCLPMDSLTPKQNTVFNNLGRDNALWNAQISHYLCSRFFGPNSYYEDAKQIVKSIILSLQNLYTHLGIIACSW